MTDSCLFDLANAKGWRLREAGEFDAVFRGNQHRVSSHAFLILALETDLNQCRLGLVISKKNVKLATQRNRVKRVVREQFRHHFTDFDQGIDMVVLARSGVDSRNKATLNQQIKSLMEKLSRKVGRQKQDG